MSLTKTSEVMGSPNYMSPEQLRASRDVDERTDIWALGVILFELLGGTVPFDAKTVTQLTAMVLLDPARSVREVRPDVPDALENLIARCLEKDPAKRPQTVAEIAEVLEPFVPEHSKGLSRRIRQVGEVRGARSGPPVSGVLSSPPNSRVPVTGGTSVSWSKTELAAGQARQTSSRPTADILPAPAPLPGPRWLLVAAFMLLGTGLGVAIVLLYARSRPTAASPPPSVTSSETTAAAAAPPPMRSSGDAAAGSATPPAVSGDTAQPQPPATASAPASDATTKTKPHGTTPHTTPTARPPSDDMPGDRH
jgi:eukaryotic-like serine/threonine-protein kinase